MLAILAGFVGSQIVTLRGRESRSACEIGLEGLRYKYTKVLLPNGVLPGCNGYLEFGMHDGWSR